MQEENGVTPEVPTPDVTAIPEETPQLDESVSERTAKNFEKLTAQIAERNAELERLRAENELLKNTPAIPELKIPELPTFDFSPEKYQALSQKEIDNMVDKVTTPDGYVDEKQLKSVLAAANKAAREAMEAAKSAKAEANQTKSDLEREKQEREIKRAYKSYPTLNPKDTDNFDQKFYNLVRNEMAAQRMEGKTPNLMEACAIISETYTPAVTKKQEQENAKRIINSSSPQRGARESSTATHQDLSLRMRSGSLRDQREALKERLAKIEGK